MAILPATILLKGYDGDKGVYLANAVLLSRATYDQRMGVQKDSRFVKGAAVAIWSTEILAQRSFTGTLSNCFVAEGGQRPPQQPLSPHKVDALRGEIFGIDMFQGTGTLKYPFKTQNCPSPRQHSQCRAQGNGSSGHLKERAHRNKGPSNLIKLQEFDADNSSEEHWQHAGGKVASTTGQKSARDATLAHRERVNKVDASAAKKNLTNILSE
ncbi:hypothetical protein HPB52_019397 [Rhipicephalus sanguineus]|uniref:Uncharacterized protein n=1 Tax=Rhipicephalus sanguineus TaxID=34632 RepID=A0A9D4QAQ2_RHISA|nr:hypothetical protein HPB52_019397 [Rhipicephalus sanguineus]